MFTAKQLKNTKALKLHKFNPIVCETSRDEEQVPRGYPDNSMPYMYENIQNRASYEANKSWTSQLYLPNRVN